MRANKRNTIYCLGGPMNGSCIHLSFGVKSTLVFTMNHQTGSYDDGGHWRAA